MNINLPWLYPITRHISTPYKHKCLYPGHKHKCLYPVDIYLSVRKLLRSKIAHYRRTGEFCRSLSPKSAWDTEYWAKFIQIIKILEIKFTYFCLVLTIQYTVSSIPFIMMVGHRHMCLYPSLFHDEKLQNFNCPCYKHMCLYAG